MILLSLVGKATAEEANLLPKGDFAAALDGWTVNDGAGSCAVKVDPAVKFGEKNAVLLRREKAEVKTEGFAESKPFAVKPTQTYLLEFSVKGKDIPRNTPELLTARFFPSAQPNAGVDWVKAGISSVGAYPSQGPGPGGALPFGTFDWQPYRLYLRAYNGSDAAAVRFSAPPSGTLWISDVRVTAVPVVRGLKCEMRNGIPLGDVYGSAQEGYLTDGYFCWNQGFDNQKISRGYRGLESGITISLTLPKIMSVDRLVLSTMRPNPGHTLKKIEVRCNKYGQSVKAAEGPGYLTEEFDQRLWMVEIPVRQQTDSIELKLFGGGYLCPYEVLVVEGEGAKEDMNKYLAAGWFVLAAATAPAAQEPVVIENDVVRMEFCPVEGGVCKRLLYKPANKELVYAYTDAGYGLFRDRFWAPTWRDFADVVYQHEETKTPNSVSIHLWGRGAGGIYSFTEVHKTITLTQGSPLIRAEYELKNNVDSMTDAEYGFWVHNFLGVMGGKNLYFIPTVKGTLEVWNDPNQRPQNAELWVKDPARGWMAGIGDARTGLAWSVDYKYLNLYYLFLGIAIPTCEWQYNRISVPCGQSLRTEVTLMPFTGLDRVDGYFQGVAGSLTLPQTVEPNGKIAPQVGLVAAGDRKLTLKFRSRLLPAAAWTELGTTEVALKNTAAQNVPWPKEMTVPAGTTVFACELLENGQTLGSMERPLTAGAASGQYAMAPECAQIGSKEEPAVAVAKGGPEKKLSLEVVSPHVPWGKPYARGTVKALILANCTHQREIVEIMQRFDLDVETEKLFFDVTNGYFPYYGEQSVRTPQEAQARLKKKLEQKFDVIVIAGLRWSKTFDADARKAILDKARAGTGLVFIAPVSGGDDLKQALPFAVGEKESGYGFIELKQKHPLTVGIPYELLPQIQGVTYEGQIPADKVLLTHKGPKEAPLMAIGEVGKGRWVCILWDVYSHGVAGEGWAFSRMTPLVLNETDQPTAKPGLLKDRAGREITWRCWEYFFSLMGRGVLWAANREPELTADVKGQDEKGDVTGTVDSPDARRGVVLEMTYRNKFAEDEKTDRKTVDLAKGTNDFRFTPPPDLMPGMTLADLRILTPQGKVAGWAAGYYETKPALAISGVEFDKLVFPPRAEPVVRGRVKFSGDPDPDHALDVLLTDFYGRVVARQSLKATKPPMAFEVKPLDTLAISMTLELRLRRGAQALDKRTEPVLFLKERTWDPKECCQYEWYCSPFPCLRLTYVFDLASKLTGQIGITSMMDNPYFARLDAEANSITSPLCFWDISDPKFHEKANAYAKSKDKKFLVRQPCLTDPAYRDKAKAAMRNAAQTAMTYGGGYAYCLGDEMTLTSYNSYYDYDFAPASIAAFREWLKKRYGTMEALNKEWETAYKDWAEIEPMTAEEARKRDGANYAPWADFRTFMDDSLSGFFDHLQACLAEVDPGAKVSISGSQDCTAATGMDWWKLSHSLRAVHSYFNENTQYMHQAFSRQSGLLVAPYLNNACGRMSGPIREGHMWWSLFYETFGLTSLGTTNYFLPDLTLTETAHEAKNFLSEVRGGPWQLLRSARRDPAPIALLYSQPSIQGNCILNREQRCQKVRDAWVTLLHDSGLQFDFVAYAQLDGKGFLSKQGYKVLVLPEALALSETEAADIKSFAQAGGVVIADNSVGWMNEHCRTLKAGQLDGLFGLSSDRQPYVGAKPKLTLKEDWGGLKRGESLAGFAPAEKITPAKATPLLTSDDPFAAAIYRCPVGKGQAVLLNLSLVPYREERQMGGRGETTYRQLIAGALALAGVRPEFPLEATGKRTFHGHVVPFTDGNIRYLGVIREFSSSDPDDSYAIRLPAAFQVYDVRAGKHLGKIDAINVVLYAGAAKLYALMPAEMAAPVLDCPASSRIGAKLALKARLPAPQNAWRAVRIEVFDPSGVKRPYYSSAPLLRPGAPDTDVAFNLALNDPAGEWTIKAIEAVSGKTVAKKITVKE